MKKKLLLVGLLGMLSTGAFAFSGDFGMKLESYSYLDGANTNSNNFIPGASVNINPIKGSNLKLGAYFGKRVYTHDGSEFGKINRRIEDQRERTDVYISHSFDFGNFTFAPKFQLRNESFADGTYKNSQEYRIFYNMKYKLSNKTGLFFNGYSGIKMQEASSQRAYDHSAASSDGREKYQDYHHEYELGTSYKVTDKGTATISIWNEYYNYESRKSSSETQLRLAYKQNIGDKFSLTPYARISLQKDEYMKDQDSSTVSVQERDRVGLKGDYQVSPTFKLYAEFYLQPSRKTGESFDESKEILSEQSFSDPKVEQYFSIGFTQKF